MDKIYYFVTQYIFLLLFYLAHKRLNIDLSLKAIYDALSTELLFGNEIVRPIVVIAQTNKSFKKLEQYTVCCMKKAMRTTACLVFTTFKWQTDLF